MIPYIEQDVYKMICVKYLDYYKILIDFGYLIYDNQEYINIRYRIKKVSDETAKHLSCFIYARMLKLYGKRKSVNMLKKILGYKPIV